MPALPISFEILTRRLTDRTGAALSSLDAKLNDVIPYELSVTRDGRAIALPGATLLLGVKQRSALTVAPFALAEGARSGSGIFTRWRFDLDLRNNDLRTLINATRSLPLELALELKVTMAGSVSIISSLYLPFNVDGDVVREDDEVGSGLGSSAFGYVRGVISRAVFAALPTASLPDGAIRQIITLVAGTRVGSEHYLAPGPADGANPDHTAPVDYDSATNNRHWEQISGLSA